MVVERRREAQGRESFNELMRETAINSRKKKIHKTIEISNKSLSNESLTSSLEADTIVHRMLVQ